MFRAGSEHLPKFYNNVHPNCVWDGDLINVTHTAQWAINDQKIKKYHRIIIGNKLNWRER